MKKNENRNIFKEKQSERKAIIKKKVKIISFQAPTVCSPKEN